MAVPKWQIEQYLWLEKTYFSNPQRRVQLKAGEVLLDQGQRNERLYLVLKGEASCSHRLESEEEFIHVLTAREGEFIGIQSFFSGSYKSFYRVIAKSDIELTYIDKNTPREQDDRDCSMIEQFVPVIASELSARHIRAALAAKDKDSTQKRLAHTEQIATLGKMAAGIAHELNNAMGVLKQGRSSVSEYINNDIRAACDGRMPYFRAGEQAGATASSAEVRKIAREYEKEFSIDRNTARRMANVAPSKADLKSLGGDFLLNKETYIDAWELGRTLHDMQIAVEHASNIVRSVKQLGREISERKDAVQVNETLNQALTLLKSETRQVEVKLSFGNLPTIVADETELIQIWVNLIKNAQEALVNSGTPEPEISVLTRGYRNHLTVVISDNGPGIPDVLQQKVFEPDFSTKKTGLSFGLGLGLSIVQRIVVSHGGELLLESQPGNTKFKIRLPI